MPRALRSKMSLQKQSRIKRSWGKCTARRYNFSDWLNAGRDVLQDPLRSGSPPNTDPLVMCSPNTGSHLTWLSCILHNIHVVLFSRFQNAGMALVIFANRSVWFPERVSSWRSVHYAVLSGPCDEPYWGPGKYYIERWSYSLCVCSTLVTKHYSFKIIFLILSKLRSLWEITKSQVIKFDLLNEMFEILVMWNVFTFKQQYKCRCFL